MGKSRNTDRKQGIKIRRNWGVLNPVQRSIPAKKPDKFTKKEFEEEIDSLFDDYPADLRDDASY